MQVVNFLVLGTLPLAFAAGRRQSLRGTRGVNGAPVLFAIVGIAIFQRIAIIADFTWISMVALHLIRREDAKIQPGG